MLKDGEPLTYAYYHQIKKGKTQKNAPTYIKDESKKIKEGNMEKYKCSVCEYIYDPKKGDPDSGIVPGTSFIDLPEDWVCPVCGAGKNSFEKEDWVMISNEIREMQMLTLRKWNYWAYC